MEVLRVPVQANKVNREFQCDFCPVSFGTLAAKYEHVHNHFEEEICQNCDQRLLRIAGEWYVLHAAVTCVKKAIKTETISPEKHSDYEGQMATQFDDSSENQISSIELDPFGAFDINQAINHVELLEPEHEIDLEYDITKSNPPDTVTEISLGELSIKFEELDERQVEMNDTSEDLQDVNDSQEKPQKTVKTSVDHRGRKMWHCEYCPKKFNSNSNRYVHIIRIHYPQYKKFKCERCKLTFATQRELYRHDKVRSKVCNVCNESFCTKSILDFHRKTYHSMDDDLEKEPNENDSEEIVTNNAKSELQCPICMKMYKTKYNVQIHTIRVHAPSMKQFKCSTCDKAFSTRLELTRHNGITPNVCEFCDKQFCTKSILRFHQVKLCSFNTNKDEGLFGDQSQMTDGVENEPELFGYPNRKKKHQCDECSRIFPRRYKLTNHFLRVHRPSLIKFKCDKCMKLFIREIELDNHNERKIICNRCGISFCAQSLYQIHIEQDCNSKRIRRCEHDECNEKVSPNEWIKHYTTKHNDIYKRFECDICQKIFTTKCSIRDHILTSHSKSSKLLECSQCEYSFITKTRLSAHRKSVHSKKPNFVCPECGKIFKQKYQMRIHSNMHSGTKPFECFYEGCSKRFTGTPQRIEHMRMHTGEKPFVCPVEGCDRRFAYSVGLRRHKFSGHGIYTKKHPCLICQEVFSEALLLNRHMKKHENQI